MNDQEKAALLIKALPDDIVLELMMIAMISPINQKQGYRLNEKGREALRVILESKIANMEAITMTEINPVTVDASGCLIGVYKVVYDILENLDSPFENPEELAAHDEAFFVAIEKIPVMKHILTHLVNELKHA